MPPLTPSLLLPLPHPLVLVLPLSLPLFLSPLHTLPARDQIKGMKNLLKMDGMALALLCNRPCLVTR